MAIRGPHSRQTLLRTSHLTLYHPLAYIEPLLWSNPKNRTIESLNHVSGLSCCRGSPGPSDTDYGLCLPNSVAQMLDSLRTTFHVASHQA